MVKVEEERMPSLIGSEHCNIDTTSHSIRKRCLKSGEQRRENKKKNNVKFVNYVKLTSKYNKKIKQK